jgi:hypothetical protein
MAFNWPQFSDKQPLDGKRAWTAKLDSYDQRSDDCYYVVSVWNGEQAGASFMAKIGLAWVGDDWSEPAFSTRLREELANVARGGVTNTDYRGSVF